MCAHGAKCGSNAKPVSARHVKTPNWPSLIPKQLAVVTVSGKSTYTLPHAASPHGSRLTNMAPMANELRPLWKYRCTEAGPLLELLKLQILLRQHPYRPSLQAFA